MFSVFLLIHTYIAGGRPYSMEISTQQLALQGHELTDGWQSQHCVSVVLCPDFIFSPFLCNCFQLCIQVGIPGTLQLKIYPAMLTCYCADQCLHIVLCLTFAMA